VLSLDFAAFKYVFGQGSENGLFPEIEPESVHPPHETPLLVTDTSESFSQSVMIPMKVGPIRAIMDIQAHSPHFMRRI
jgi:hypothetical protein